MITLGVADLDRSRGFYAALGWQGQTVQGTAFFQAGGLVVVLWARTALADDAGVEDLHSREGFGGIALAHNVRSKPDVDAVIAAAESAGAQVTGAPADTFYGGYAGYFRDPDGHVWEVAWNPGFEMGDDGAVTLPDFGADR